MIISNFSTFKSSQLSNKSCDNYNDKSFRRQRSTNVLVLSIISLFYTYLTDEALQAINILSDKNRYRSMSKENHRNNKFLVAY